MNRRREHLTSAARRPTSRGARPVAGRTGPRRRGFLPVLLLLLLAGAPPGTLGAQSAESSGDGEEQRRPPGSALPPEDPEELFDIQVGDQEADVFVQGKWESSLAGATGLAILPEPVDGSRLVFPYTFPGLDPPLFINAVDLTISVWLFEHYYLEATVIDELELGTLVFGYQGPEDAFLRDVRVGTDSFAMESYPYLNQTRGEEPAFGAYLRAEGPGNRHELLLQYQAAEGQRDVYLGRRLLNERVIDPASYLRGRFFVLPDGNVENPIVYLEDPEGEITGSDGRSYRRARLGSEAVISAAEGRLTLPERPAGRVLVSYTKGGAPVGSSGLGTEALVYAEAGMLAPGAGEPIDFSFRSESYLGIPLDSLEVRVEGASALLIQDPARFSPFELQNRYALGSDGNETEAPAAENAEARLQWRSGGDPFPLPGIDLTREEDLLIVTGPAESPRDAGARYPFALDEAGYPELYGPPPASGGETTPFVLALRTLTEVSEVTLPNRVIPGSVSVTRNGLPEYGYRLDPGTGALRFVTPISPLDRIELRYRLESAGSEVGDATLAYGNRIRLGERSRVESSLRGSAPFPSGSTGATLPWSGYTTALGERPASTTLAGRYSLEGEQLSLEADLAAELELPDATGLLRLAGMEDAARPVPITQEAILPAAPPGDAISAFPGLSAERRGEVLYRDYFQDIFGGRQLRDYDWPLPEDQIYPYEAGSRVGPYPVGARVDSFASPVMAIDFRMDGGAAGPGDQGRHWVAGRLQLPPGLRDLSQVEGLRLDLRAEDPPTGSVAVYLLAGQVNEDSDADGVLDAGESVLEPRYPFSDRAAGIVLEAGAVAAGIGPAVSEDADGNGILDAAEAGLVVRELAASAEAISGSWKTVELSLDATERRLLAESRALDIVVVNTGSTPAEGRLLIGNLELQEAGFALYRESGAVTARQRRADDLSDLPGNDNSLGSRDGAATLEERRESFKTAVPGVERLLDLQWEAGTERWLLRRAVSPVPPGSYEELVLFVRPIELASAGTLVVELAERARPPGDILDTGTEGGARIAGTIPLPAGTTEWLELRLRPAAGEVLVNGESLGTLVTENWREDRSVGLLSLRLDGVDSGRLLVDEVHLAGSSPRGSMIQRSSLNYRPDWQLSAGGVELLSGFALEQELVLRSGNLFEDPFSRGSATSRSRVGAQFPGFRLDGRAEAGIAGEVTRLSLGHELRVPRPSAPLLFRDDFTTRMQGGSPEHAHTLGLDVALPDAGGRERRILGAEYRTVFGSDGLRRLWSTTLSGAGFLPAGPALSLQLSETDADADLPDPALAPGYGERWWESLRRFVPALRDGATRRSASARGSFLLEGNVLGAGGELNAELSRQVAARRDDLLEGHVSLPITLSPESPDAMRITPRYSRRVGVGDSVTEDAGFAGAIRDYGRMLAGQRYVYASIPGLELFASSLPSDFAEQSGDYSAASYEAEAELQLEGAPGFRPVDLLIPSGVSAGISRELRRRESGVEDTRSTILRLRTVALNLFGSQGARPLTSLYRSDEYRLEASLQRDRTLLPGALDEASNTLSAALDGRFFGAEQNALTVAPELGYAWEGLGSARKAGSLKPSLEAVFSWTARRIPDWRIPVITEPVSALVHREKLAGSADWDLAGGYLEGTLVGTHSSTLQFGRRGDITLAVDVGLGRENAREADAGGALILGLQGSLSGTLNF